MFVGANQLKKARTDNKFEKDMKPLSMDAKFDDFAKRDGWTERRTDGATDGRTDTPAYWDAMDASKKKACVIYALKEPH